MTETDSLGLYQNPLAGEAPCSMCGQDTSAQEQDAQNRNFFGTAYFMLPGSHYIGSGYDEGVGEYLQSIYGNRNVRMTSSGWQTYLDTSPPAKCSGSGNSIVCSIAFVAAGFWLNDTPMGEIGEAIFHGPGMHNLWAQSSMTANAAMIATGVVGRSSDYRRSSDRGLHALCCWNCSDTWSRIDPFCVWNWRTMGSRNWQSGYNGRHVTLC